jgi:hypothetical protein
MQIQKGRQQAKLHNGPTTGQGLTMSQTSKWADNGPGLTRSQNSKGSTTGQGQLGPKIKIKRKMSPLGRLSNRHTELDRRVARMMWSLRPLLLLLQKGRQRAWANNGQNIKRKLCPLGWLSNRHTELDRSVTHMMLNRQRALGGAWRWT